MTKDNEFWVICINEAEKSNHLFDDIIIVLYHLFDFRCVFIKLLHGITQLPGWMHISPSLPYRVLHKLLFLNHPTLVTTNTSKNFNLQILRRWNVKHFSER